MIWNGIGWPLRGALVKGFHEIGPIHGAALPTVQSAATNLPVVVCTTVLALFSGCTLQPRAVNSSWPNFHSRRRNIPRNALLVVVSGDKTNIETHRHGSTLGTNSKLDDPESLQFRHPLF